MDERTLTALKGSIAKWEAIVAGTGADHGPDNCPLCERYFMDQCFGCPVREKTRRGGCCRSPYVQWDDARFKLGTCTASTPELVVLAQAEVDFLRSLLPVEAAIAKAEGQS